MKVKNYLHIVTGNKGGCGKSTTAILLTDHLIRQKGYEKVYCSDSEMSTIQATFWMMCRQNKQIEDSHKPVFELGLQQGFDKILNFFDEHQGEGVHVVIDTGASTMKTLLDNIAYIAEEQEQLNFSIHNIFVCNDLSDSKVAAKIYCENIKKISNVATDFVLMSPSKVNDKIIDFGDYECMKSVETQETMKTLGKIIQIGYIPDAAYDLIMRQRVWPCAAISDSTILYGERKRLLMFLRTVDDAFGHIQAEK